MIPRYLMVACTICSGIRCADRPCHYCGARIRNEGEYLNYKGIAIARAAGDTLAAKIRRVAEKLGIAA